MNLDVMFLGQWLEEVQIGKTIYTYNMEILFKNFGK
jgi:hypothetical protein